MTYPVNNALDKEGNETGKALAWEKVFIQLAQVWQALSLESDINDNFTFLSKIRLPSVTVSRPVVAASVPTFLLLAEIVSLILHEISG